MPHSRKGILIAALALFLAAGSYPPWVRTFDFHGSHRQTPAGYWPLFLPPAAEDNVYAGVSIDLTRLLIEWAIIAAIAYGTWLIASVRRSKQQPTDENSEKKGGKYG